MITTVGSPSHGRAQLPLVRALAAAGHEVLAVTTEPTASVFAQENVRVTSSIKDFIPGDHAAVRLKEISARTDLEESERNALIVDELSRTLSGRMAEDLLEAVLPEAREFRPDLILRDGMDMSSVLIGQMFGIPQLPTPSGASNSMNPAEILPGLNVLRAKHGLPTDESPLSIVPHGRIDYVPSEFTFAAYLPASFSYRQTVTVDRDSVLPRWVVDLPTDRPLVFAALGTALPMLHQMLNQEEPPELPFTVQDPVTTLRSLIGAAALLEECTVIVATAGLPTDTDALPPHVHLTDRLPQPLLLEACDLLLTHGGFNSIRESLRTATPMAILPQFGDQPGNALRVEELGLGRLITDTTADGIAGVCRAVLADPAIGARARRARLAMLALPEIEAAVADLEALVA
ncbi:nucleotide disphospho-sugar-binding domain-containing protein [Streptomyces sp. NPDC001985]|uniref:glycosyltransferase n=1 Tax=Streptomyces sp. NPDC001985 TaxID=3154406 RepID=UPI003316CBB6